MSGIATPHKGDIAPFPGQTQRRQLPLSHLPLGSCGFFPEMVDAADDEPRWVHNAGDVVIYCNFIKITAAECGCRIFIKPRD